MLLRLALPGVVGLLLVLGAACLTAPPTPTPEAPFSPEDRPFPVVGSLGPSALHERVRVVVVGSERVNLRAQPGTDGARVKGLLGGTELELIGADTILDGKGWRNVRDPSDGSEGWVAAEFVAPS